MSATLHEAMTAGVIVEFVDAFGQMVGQTVFTEWQGRPLPAKGDHLCCVVPAGTVGKRKLWGEVVARQFDIQADEAGQPCVWARLEVCTRTRLSENRSPRMR